MLKKCSIFMVLLVATATFVGISSIYQPANVETQPQQPTQKPPGFVLPPVQQPNNGPITQEQAKTFNQAMADIQLLDRIFPIIIQRIDGKTLAQKIDAATLLQKIDARTLAAKVLPYLDLNVVLTQRPGQIGSINVGTLGSGGGAWGNAKCAPDETAVSAGFTHQAKGDLSVFTLRRNDPNSNSWDITTAFDDTGKVFTYAECLKVELVLKPSQPLAEGPGGLQNLRKPLGIK